MIKGSSGYQPPIHYPPRASVTVMPPGWYPDPESPNVARWWDGQQWTSHRQAPPASSGTEMRGLIKFVCLALTLVGAGIAMLVQVSVASGTGTVWVGAVLACVGAIGAGVMKTGTGTRVVCILLAVAAIASASYDQHQVDKKRQQIEQILNGG